MFPTEEPSVAVSRSFTSTSTANFGGGGGGGGGAAAAAAAVAGDDGWPHPLHEPVFPSRVHTAVALTQPTLKPAHDGYDGPQKQSPLHPQPAINASLAESQTCHRIRK